MTHERTLTWKLSYVDVFSEPAASYYLSRQLSFPLTDATARYIKCLCTTNVSQAVAHKVDHPRSWRDLGISAPIPDQ